MGGSAKVHPLAEDEPASLGHTEYMVPADDLRRIYSEVREIFLAGHHLQEGWLSAGSP